MRNASHPIRTFAVTSLAVLATGLGTLAPATAAPPDPMQPGTTKERGVLLECRGMLGADPVIVNLYQNKLYGNHLEIQVGEGAGEVGTGRESSKKFVQGNKVKARARLAGKKVVIKGKVLPTGEVREVDDHFDDAGLWIDVTGTHHLLDPQVAFSWGKRATKLVCDPAFRFELTVVKTAIEG